MERKLAAIFSADVQGYSRLMGDDEAATVRTLTAYREVMTTLIQQHRGRVVDSPGDNMLAEFGSVVDAVHCAVTIQQDLATHNESLPDHRKMQFRIGINLGDVITEDEQLYGDGVNIAARMEGLAEGGGICISGTAYDQVHNKIALGYTSMGEQSVKNIANPVRAYQVVMDADAVDQVKAAKPSKRTGRRAVLVTAAVALMLVIAGVVVWQVMRSSKPHTEVATEDPVLALPKGPRIAVLPFINMSGDPKQEYFVDGITEDITTKLSRFQDLLILGRDATIAYKDAAVDAQTIGRDVGADFVIKGSIRRAADTIRVTAQLLDAATGGIVWSETFDRDLTVAGVFAVQDEITQKVVATIAGETGIVVETRASESRGADPESLSAYECVLRAKWFYANFSEDVFQTALRCLKRTVAYSPDYAAAWAWLALLLQEQYSSRFEGEPNPLERSHDAAQRALALAPHSQAAHNAIMQDHFFRHELDQVGPAAARMVALNPNNANNVAAAGFYMALAGGWDRGTALLEQTMAIFPNYPGWCHVPLALNQLRMDDYHASLAQARRINLPGWFWYHSLLAANYGHLGQIDNAQTEASNLLAASPAFIEMFWKDVEMWNLSETIVARYRDGLRKAGLDIPPE